MSRPGDRDAMPLDDALLAACVHCGLCLESCATFVETGREEESPRGRLVLMSGLAQGRWEPRPDVLRHLDSCLACRACETACPSGVAYGSLLETARAVTARDRDHPRSGLERFLVRHVLWRTDWLIRFTRFYRFLGVGRWGWKLARAPLPESWRRSLRLLPRAERPRSWPVSDRASGPRAYVLRGCAARALFPETERAMARLLDAAGYVVVPLDVPSCCGALARHLGDVDLARRLVAPLLARAMESDAVVVATAAGCGAHLKDLGHLFPPGPERDGAVAVAGRTRDLTEALVGGPRALRFRAAAETDVVFQDPCHLRHAQGITEAPRLLLREAGARVRESAEADLCCGSAGSYNLGQGELAERLGRRKATILRDSGARTVVTANPGCQVQLEAYAREMGVRVVPLARFLAERLDPVTSSRLPGGAAPTIMDASPPSERTCPA